MVRTVDEASDISPSGSSALNSNGPISSSCTSVKDAFLPLTWALKVLTLDQPADIKKYVIPLGVTESGSEENIFSVGLLSENKIRKIMGRRVDFSKDAVLKVKITIK